MDTNFFLLLFSVLTLGNSQSYNRIPYTENNCLDRLPKANMSDHILQNPDFWQMFKKDVETKKWKCSFAQDILHKGLEKDSTLYKDDAVFRHRRNGAKLWILNDSLWISTILGACKELANGRSGIFTTQLEKLHMLSALEDFVDHIHYFYEIAHSMEHRGERVSIKAQNSSTIHDIDKLDPVMLIAYSERFEDGKNTSLWNTCVDRHVHINPHHQQHCLWHDCCEMTDIKSCNDVRNTALREMVCDKVSRRLQKNFDGKKSDEMWDADIGFYNGLPQPWLNKAVNLMHAMKNWKDKKQTSCQ